MNQIILLVLIVINPNQCISFDSTNIKYLNSFSNLLIPYGNVNHQSNSLSVFNVNNLDKLIKVSNVSLSCGSSLRRFNQVFEGHHFEYWSIAS